MLAAMKAVRIPASGPVVVLELAPAEDDDTTAFLAGLYAAIGCQSVECVELTTTWDMWLDETGMVEGRVANHRATLLAQSCGVPVQIFCDVVVTGTNDDAGRPGGLTNDQAEGILRHIGGPEAAGQGGDDIQTLTHLLNAWDPIGVADMVSDEYDCMIMPLRSRLAAGRSQAEISDFLRHELADHFGLDPAQYDTDTVANQLIAWWAQTQQR